MKPVVTPEEESYRFGPGEPRVSTQRWHVPIGIGGKNMVIKTPTLEDRPSRSEQDPMVGRAGLAAFHGHCGGRGRTEDLPEGDRR